MESDIAFESVKYSQQSNAKQINDRNEIELINSTYDKIQKDEQQIFIESSMRTMWQAIKDDEW